MWLCLEDRLRCAINKPSCIPTMMGPLRTCSTMLKSASLEKSVSVLRRRADFRDSISRISSNLVDDDNDNDDDNEDDEDDEDNEVGEDDEDHEDGYDEKYDENDDDDEVDEFDKDGEDDEDD